MRVRVRTGILGTPRWTDRVTRLDAMAVAAVLGTALALALLGMALNRPDIDPFLVGEEEAAGLEQGHGGCRLKKPLLEVARAEGGRAAERWFLGLPDGLLVAAESRADVNSGRGGSAPSMDVWLVGAMQPRFGLPGPGLTGGEEATPEQEEAWHRGGGLRYFAACDLGGDRTSLDTTNSDGTGDSMPRIGVRLLSVPCGRPVSVEVWAEGGLGSVGLRITVECACGLRSAHEPPEGRGGPDLDGPPASRDARPRWTAKRLPPDTPGLGEWAVTRARWWKDLQAQAESEPPQACRRLSASRSRLTADR